MKPMEFPSKTLLCVLPFLLLACGHSSPDAAPAPTAETPPETPEEEVSAPPSVQLSENPFQLCFNDEVCTATAPTLAAPLAYSYTEGPRPQHNPATATAMPAFGWVVGPRESSSSEVIPTFIWQGNRAAASENGTFYQVTTIAETRELDDRTEVVLNTNYPDTVAPETALLTLKKLASGATEAHLTPPAGMAEEGIRVAMFTIESPTDEGLFGMGARKDFFNQRGKLRNVWTEQQNTGLGSICDLSLTGAGAPALPAGDCEAAGVDPDSDDGALAEERTSFPNGAQAAYWVEAFVVGSRGWSAWTEQKHFQRLDLGVTQADRIRWQIVDSDEITLLFSDGGIEQASKTYTEYWGRSQAPTPKSWEPWIDTLNQGEGEAAPNGQGFWGGQRARCEIEEFIAFSNDKYQIPFSLIGVEGWHTLPQAHPNCTVLSTAEICGHINGYPVDAAGMETEFQLGTSFLNVKENCADADKTFFDYVKAQGFEIGGYWNFFHTDQNCPDDDQSQCEASHGVPTESKQAFLRARDDYDIYVKAVDPNADTTDDNGNHTVTTNRGGISSLIDFTSDRAVPYWKEQLSRMLDQGITIFMHDFGELTTDDMLFEEGENLTESHNLFAFKYQKAARIAIDEYKQEKGLGDDFAPYFYARAGMTGACSFTPGVFPGDESTTWDQGHGLPSVIPTMLNLALSGCYAFTTDIGGYFDFTTPRTTEDLFIRWSQLSALTPVMRIHSSTFNGSVFPWTWEEENAGAGKQYETVDIFRRYAKLKVNLIPLITHWVDLAAADGTVGPVRPIVLEDLSAEAMAIDYQWLLGKDILVAPVVFEDAVSQDVYFPAGSRWELVTVNDEGQFVGTGTVYDGGTSGQVAIDNTTLDDIPIFLRCGLDNELVPTVGNAGECL